jgi:hypothetical protein
MQRIQLQSALQTQVLTDMGTDITALKNDMTDMKTAMKNIQASIDNLTRNQVGYAIS